MQHGYLDVKIFMSKLCHGELCHDTNCYNWFHMRIISSIYNINVYNTLTTILFKIANITQTAIQ